MKKIVFFLLGVTSTLGILAQNTINDIEDTEDKVYYITEVMPTFNGGEPAVEFRKYLVENVEYPNKEDIKNIEGRVIVTFNVNKEGKVVDAVVVKSLHPELDKEVLRVVTSSEGWTPGRQDGKFVKVQFTFSCNVKYRGISKDLSKIDNCDGTNNIGLLENTFKDTRDYISISNKAQNEDEIRLLNKNRDFPEMSYGSINKNTISNINELYDRKLSKKKGEYYFSDGSIYAGERKKGLAEGQGRRVFQDSSFYYGRFLNGYFNGYGVLNEKNGGKYVGNFENDKREGYGIQTFPNGEVYEGNWKSNRQNGEGKYQYIDNSEYQGNWVNGNREGYGILTYKDGSVYEGNWTNDNFNGKGIYKYSNGDIYEGLWKNGMKEGMGVLTLLAGEFYDGNWANNLKNGQGKLTYKEGHVYNGEFKNDKRDGTGQLTFSDGTYYKGEWSNDEATGKGEMTNERGEYHIGNFVAGRRNGFGKTIYKDGRYYEGNWKNGQPSGQGKAVWPDGLIHEGSWKDGMRNGYGVTDFQGAIFQGEYRNDQISGRGKITYDDGESYDGDWESNYKHGNGKLTLPNGDVFIGEFAYDKIMGKGKLIKVNGEVYEGDWKNGRYVVPDEQADHNENKSAIETEALGNYLLFLKEVYNESNYESGSSDYANDRLEYNQNRGVQNECSYCRGTGRCPTCSKVFRVHYYQRGVGYKDRNETRPGLVMCTTCRGSGEIYGGITIGDDYPKYRVCNVCDGTGWRNCPECNNLGNGKHIGECDHCNGTGFR